ncbi:MAG: hypothetical protein M5U09_19400 [Gammaproteobacteria bacterium]|nr:hypothetical protein [Gammaproteobacteria bacterium]
MPAKVMPGGASQSSPGHAGTCEAEPSYTNIFAPISGVVVERDDVGQTVAASLSAPQIFSSSRRIFGG